METILNYANDPLVWTLVAIVFTALLAAWRVIAWYNKIPVEPVQTILEEGKAFAENKAEELKEAQEVQEAEATKESIPVKNKGGRPRKVITSIIFLGLLMSSCAGWFSKDEIKTGIKDGIDIIKYFTTDKDSASTPVPIDSIIIRFNPVYYKSSNYIGFGEQEKDTLISGYRIWELQTVTMRRTEIQKLDSIIYIYKK